MGGKYTSLCCSAVAERFTADFLSTYVKQPPQIVKHISQTSTFLLLRSSAVGAWIWSALFRYSLCAARQISDFDTIGCCYGYLVARYFFFQHRPEAKDYISFKLLFLSVHCYSPLPAVWSYLLLCPVQSGVSVPPNLHAPLIKLARFGVFTCVRPSGCEKDTKEKKHVLSKSETP